MIKKVFARPDGPETEAERKEKRPANHSSLACSCSCSCSSDSLFHSQMKSTLTANQG